MTTQELIAELQRHPDLPVKVEVKSAPTFPWIPGGKQIANVEIERVQFSSASDYGRTCVKIVVEV